MLPDKDLLQKPTLNSLRSSIAFRIEELGMDSRKNQNVRSTQNQARTEITLKRRFKVEMTDRLASSTLAPNYTPSTRHLQATIILGEIPQRNLQKKLGSQSQELKFGFKITDLVAVSKGKQKLMRAQNKDKTRDKISEMRALKIQKVRRMVPVSLETTILFLWSQNRVKTETDSVYFMSSAYDPNFSVFLGTYPAKHTFSFSRGRACWRW